MDLKYITRIEKFNIEVSKKIFEAMDEFEIDIDDVPDLVLDIASDIHKEIKSQKREFLKHNGKANPTTK